MDERKTYPMGLSDRRALANRIAQRLQREGGDVRYWAGEAENGDPEMEPYDEHKLTGIIAEEVDEYFGPVE